MSWILTCDSEHEQSELRSNPWRCFPSQQTWNRKHKWHSFWILIWMRIRFLDSSSFHVSVRMPNILAVFAVWIPSYTSFFFYFSIYGCIFSVVLSGIIAGFGYYKLQSYQEWHYNDTLCLGIILRLADKIRPYLQISTFLPDSNVSIYI